MDRVQYLNLCLGIILAYFCVYITGQSVYSHEGRPTRFSTTFCKRVKNVHKHV